MNSLLDKLKMLGYIEIATSSGISIHHKKDTIKLISGENEISLIHPLTKTSTSETNIWEYSDITFIEEQLKYRNTTRAVVLLPDGKIYDSADEEKLQKMTNELQLRHNANELLDHFRYAELWKKEKYGVRISDKICLFGSYLVDFYTPQVRQITKVFTCNGYIVMQLRRMNGIYGARFLMYDYCGWVYQSEEEEEVGVNVYTKEDNKALFVCKFKLHDSHGKGVQIKHFNEEMKEILDLSGIAYGKFSTRITDLINI